MNNQKQQALEALDMIDVHTGKDSKSDYWYECFEFVKQFIESVDSISLRDRKEIVIRKVTGKVMIDADNLNKVCDIVNQNIPDTLNTSCRCNELQPQLEDERENTRKAKIISDENAALATKYFKRLKSTQEQLEHMKNLYDAERIFHQKVTDALGDEREKHTEEIENYNNIISRLEKRIDGIASALESERAWDFQPLPVKFAEVPAIEKQKSLSDIKIDLIRKIIEE